MATEASTQALECWAITLRQSCSIGGSIVYKPPREVSEEAAREKRGALSSCFTSEFRRREVTPWQVVVGARRKAWDTVHECLISLCVYQRWPCSYNVNLTTSLLCLNPSIHAIPNEWPRRSLPPDSSGFSGPLPSTLLWSLISTIPGDLNASNSVASPALCLGLFVCFSSGRSCCCKFSYVLQLLGPK